MSLNPMSLAAIDMAAMAAELRQLFTQDHNLVTLYNGGVVKTGARLVAGNAVVSGGNAVFQLTEDGTAGGATLFPNGNVYLDSLMLRAEEGTSPHAFGVPVLSNSNKTLTIPITKTGAAVTVLGISVLAASVAANGSTIKMLVAGD